MKSPFVVLKSTYYTEGFLQRLVYVTESLSGEVDTVRFVVVLNTMSTNCNKKLFWSFHYEGPLVCKVLLAQAIDTLGETYYVITRHCCKEDYFCMEMFLRSREAKMAPGSFLCH